MCCCCLLFHIALFSFCVTSPCCLLQIRYHAGGCGVAWCMQNTHTLCKMNVSRSKESKNALSNMATCVHNKSQHIHSDDTPLTHTRPKIDTHSKHNGVGCVQPISQSHSHCCCCCCHHWKTPHCGHVAFSSSSSCCCCAFPARYHVHSKHNKVNCTMIEQHRTYLAFVLFLAFLILFLCKVKYWCAVYGKYTQGKFTQHMYNTHTPIVLVQQHTF